MSDLVRMEELEILFLRHSITEGNKKGRYIGRTDEPLCEEGRALLENKAPGPVQAVYSSPLKRCVETAGILWPDMAPVLADGLRECDFGTFENKNYKELDGDPDYQAWVDSQGTLPFPGGESREGFQERCCRALCHIIKEAAGRFKRIAVVAHGGTIMSVMERYGVPERDYYGWHVANGEGFLVRAAAELSDEGRNLQNISLVVCDEEK